MTKLEPEPRLVARGWVPVLTRSTCMVPIVMYKPPEDRRALFNREALYDVIYALRDEGLPDFPEA